MQGVREGSVFTPYRERFAYDVANLRYRYLAGLEDEREPAYAHYFFYKEVVYILLYRYKLLKTLSQLLSNIVVHTYF